MRFPLLYGCQPGLILPEAPRRVNVWGRAGVATDKWYKRDAPFHGNPLAELRR